MDYNHSLLIVGQAERSILCVSGYTIGDNILVKVLIPVINFQLIMKHVLKK
jgi:hypothetical protein